MYLIVNSNKEHEWPVLKGNACVDSIECLEIESVSTFRAVPRPVIRSGGCCTLVVVLQDFVGLLAGIIFVRITYASVAL